jgi:molybdate transport system substrate-binding protein
VTGLRELIGLALLLPLGCAVPEGARTTITVAAASSLTGVMEEVTALWNQRPGADLRCTFGATSTLARQIESGAPFDILLSANRQWVEHLEGLGRVEPEDTFLFARNRLVVGAPSSRLPDSVESLSAGFADGGAFQGGRWAMGDPDHVPVGVYGKAALQELGHWGSVEGRVLPAPSARAALRLVERGESDFGLVYRTDALDRDGVAVVAELPLQASLQVELVGCILDGASPDVRPLVQWLRGPEVRAALVRHGFEVE